MNIIYRHITLATLLLLASATCNAQSLKEYYKALHNTTDGCKSYDGLLDKVFPLEMLICGDNGVYKMNSSSDIYNLSIDTADGSMEMVEEDNEGRNSGFITLTKSVNGYEGEWKQIESAAKYSFSLNEYGAEEESSTNYITKLSGMIRGRLVYITIDHANESVEIQEKYGLQSRYKSEYTCKDENCKKVIVKPEGIIGVSSVEIYKDKRGNYKMIVLTVDQNRESTDLQKITQVQRKTKAYSDYRSMLVAEYAAFDDKDLDQYLNKLQADWIKTTSIHLRELHKEDPTEIVSDRLKHQASSWIDIELWTDDFISGIQYKQYNWQDEVEATSFAYHIDKSKPVSLDEVWDKKWNHTQLKSAIANSNSTWVVGVDGIHKVYFDRVTGVERESFSYTDLEQYIDGGSWLDKLLDQGKIKY